MARPGYSVAVRGVETLLVTLAPIGALVTFAAATIKVRMPQSGTIVGMTLNVAVRGGTHVTSALLVQNAGNTVGTFDVDALTPGTPVDIEGTNLANADIAKDAVLSFATTEAGGTSPTWQGVTVQVDYVRKGD